MIKTTIIGFIGNLKGGRKGQVVSLYSSMLLGVVLSVLVSVMNTRLLGAQGYGDFKFLQNLFTFAITCLTFGVFVSGARLIATSDSEEGKQSVMGGLLLYVAVIFFVLVVVFFSFSYVQGDIFNEDLGDVIRYCLPFLFVYPAQVFFENVLKGDNRIAVLSVYRIMPSAIYLVVVFCLTNFINLTVTGAIIIHLLSVAIIQAIFIKKTPVAFIGVKSAIARIDKEVKGYGFNVYLGIIAGVATTTLGGISLSYFINNVAVGYFMLAMTMTQPLTMLATSIGVTFYKKFSGCVSIDFKVFVATMLLLSVSLVVYLLIIDKVVLFLYTDDFLPVVSLCMIMAIGATLQGVGGFINNFICARGYGEIARNTAFVRGAVNLLGYTVGVSYFGLIGAAYTVLGSGLVYAAIMLAAHQRIKKLATNVG